jgi:hypothetical protein
MDRNADESGKESSVKTHQHRARCAAAVAFFAVAALTIPVHGQSLQLRPGKYETTMERSAMGHTLPPLKNVECVTVEDVKNLKGFATRLAQADETCTISNYRESREKVTFTSICDEEGVRSTAHAELTLGSESFRLVVESKDDEGVEMTLTLTTRRIGACDG